MRERRKTKPLGEVCTFLNGLWTGKKPPFETALVLRNTNFRPHGRLDETDVARLKVEAKQLSKRRLQPGDIIVEKSGGGPKQPVGRVVYFDRADGVYSFSNFTSAARVIDRRELHPEYLIKFLDWCYVSGMTERMQSHSTGIRNLDFNAYKAIDVPLPAPEEQLLIVSVIDETFSAIATATANAEKNLANTRELLDRAFRERFDHVGNGWAAYRLPEISENWDSKRRPVTKSERVPGDVPYYGASGPVDSVRDHLFDHDLLLISEDGANLLMRTYPIAFSISGKSWVNNHAHVLKFADSATQRLVEYYFNFISIAPWVIGMAQPKLNQKALNDIPIPLPPPADRHRLVNELDELANQIGRLEEIQRAKAAEFAALKQSTLATVFADELTSSARELLLA